MSTTIDIIKYLMQNDITLIINNINLCIKDENYEQAYYELDDLQETVRRLQVEVAKII